MPKATRSCSIVGCAKPVLARSWCGMHYARWKRSGDPTVLIRSKNAGLCSVAGCDQAMRKRGWCASHYAQWRRTGDAQPFAYRWAERGVCKVCSEPCAQWGLREFCSKACWALWKASDGTRPTLTHCISCGIEIDLLARTAKGQRKKASVKFCRRCKFEYRKYKLTTAQLAERDGTSCGLCGEVVDMTLRRSDGLMCASVDHIQPRALGGSHEPSNLQLAHLLCNIKKSNRIEAMP